MDKMHFYIAQLQRNLNTFKALLSDKQAAEYTWKKNQDKWSLLEIICHLVDEEKEDFRVRLRRVLEIPEKMPPSIDPVGWVKSRDYQSQNYHEKLNEFVLQRE